MPFNVKSAKHYAMPLAGISIPDAFIRGTVSKLVGYTADDDEWLLFATKGTILQEVDDDLTQCCAHKNNWRLWCDYKKHVFVDSDCVLVAPNAFLDTEVVFSHCLNVENSNPACRWIIKYLERARSA